MTELLAVVYALLLALLPNDWTVVTFSVSKDTLCVATGGQAMTRCSSPDSDGDGKRELESGLTAAQVVAKWGL